MTTTIAPAPAAIHALPYVNGESYRFKAAPTKLTPLAGKVMLASGALSTRRKRAIFPMGRTVAAMALLAMTAMFFLGGGANSVRTQIVKVPPVEGLALTVGVVDQRHVAAIEHRPEIRAELIDLAPAAGVLAGQDRFEIDRFIRLSATVRHEKRGSASER